MKGLNPTEVIVDEFKNIPPEVWEEMRIAYEGRMMCDKHSFPIYVPEDCDVIYRVDSNLPQTKAGRVELMAALLERPVDGIWDRIWPILRGLIIVIVTYFVTRFMCE